MPNFKDFQKSRATNTSWRSGSDSGSSRSLNLSRATTLSVSSSISSNQHHNRPSPVQRSSTPISITTSSASAYPASDDSSSPKLGSSDSGSGYFYPSQGYPQAQVPQYLLCKLSTGSSTDRGYSSRKNGKHNSNDHENQRTHKTRSRDPPQPSSGGSSSSTESSVSSGDNRNFHLQPHRIRRGDPVDSSSSAGDSSSDSDSRGNFPLNHFNAWGFGRNPIGMPIRTPALHFINCNYFNAPPASTVPQPPQNWLFGRAEALVKEEEIEEERVMAKVENTYDYYNLKKLRSGDV